MASKFPSTSTHHTYYTGIGTSMGANLMLRVAGELGDECPFEAMVSLNNPFDIWLAINLMRNTPYEKYLAVELKKQLLFKKNMSDNEKRVFSEMSTKFNIDFEALGKVETWREWDEIYTKKAFPEYKTTADYYYAASSLSQIKNVKKPTLVIHSKDDPIVPVDCLPVHECVANPKFIVGLVHKGGHVCYFQGASGQKRWYPLVSSEYLNAVIELREQERRKEVEQIPHTNESPSLIF